MIIMVLIKFFFLCVFISNSLVIINVIERKKIKVLKILLKKMNNILYDMLNLCLKFSLYKLKE